VILSSFQVSQCDTNVVWCIVVTTVVELVGSLMRHDAHTSMLYLLVVVGMDSLATKWRGHSHEYTFRS